MFKNKRVIGIIPARGGSKRVINKNIKLIKNKPLIHWTITESLKSKYIDEIILSTDSQEIKNIAESYGLRIPFLRPYELAQDNSPTIDTILYILKKINHYDYLVLLQPTSPLRNSVDIEKCIRLCINKDCDSCVSITKSKNDKKLIFEKNKNGFLKKINHISHNNGFKLNGALYVSKISSLIKNKSFVTSKTIGYVMPKNRSIDIDTENDIKKFIESLEKNG